MLKKGVGRLALSLVLLCALSLPALAQESLEAADFSDAQFVTILLGATNDEQGIRLISGQPDGQTAVAEKGGRRSVATGLGGQRYFYFDVHDSYINGGFNQVVMTIRYTDLGKTPVELEYDAFDVINPNNMADGWIKKRVVVAERTNSGEIRTVRLVLEDARFGNNQAGGADFRLATSDELVLHHVAVMSSFDGVSNLPIRVKLNGHEVLFPDVAPMIENGSTLVPMRGLFNALGVSNNDIVWDGSLGRVTATKGQTTIILQIDSPVAWVGGQVVALNQPAVIRDNRTLIPLRFVSESLGLDVKWNPDTRLITISTPMVGLPMPTLPGPTPPGSTDPQPGPTPPGSTDPQPEPPPPGSPLPQP